MGIDNMKSQDIVWANQSPRWQDVAAVARYQARLSLSEEVWARIHNARDIVTRIQQQGVRAYGINTGLGALCNIILPDDQLSQLSRNTLMSHACGVGEPLKVEQTRAIICAAVANYSQGKSGISPVLVQGLLDLLNHGITPVVPSQGSVGYLSHMAHISLCLIGMGEVDYQGQRIAASAALQAEGLSVCPLAAKDGLSLVNGTPCMTGLTALALDDATRLADWADVTGAMSFEALRGQVVAFDPEVLALKPSASIQLVGQRLRQILAGSQIIAESEGIRTQDALSIRSIPQIHGACRDQINYAIGQVDIELRSATDNPLVLGDSENWRVVSQANPHGENVAMAADALAIALAELGSVAERRLDRLINPLVSGLPPFLLSEPGVNSGMMIAQYVAASLCGENRQLAQPAVLDNFVTSALQEDHLSMGTNSAIKLLKLIDNLYNILAIEYLLAAQAYEFFDNEKLAPGTRQAWQALRTLVAPWTQDRWLAPEIKATVSLIRQQDAFVPAV